MPNVLSDSNSQSASSLIFLDLETAGGDPKRHAIIQVGAVALDADSLEPLEAFEAKLRFSQSRACKYSLRKNGYHAGQWALAAVEPEQAAREFSRFLRRHPYSQVLTREGSQRPVAQLIAHNAAFDSPFLEVWFERADVFLPVLRPMLCTLDRLKWWFAENPQLQPPTHFKLPALCQYFGVCFQAAHAHDAMGDAIAAAGLYRELRHRQQELQQPHSKSAIHKAA